MLLKLLLAARYVEGSARYPARVRFMRELRDNVDDLGNILVSIPAGKQIPLSQLAEIKYIRAPY